MSSINGPDGINSANMLNGITGLNRVSKKTPSFVRFGGFHNPCANPAGEKVLKWSPAVLERFQAVENKFRDVAFQEYPEEERIPQLVIGDDYMEDVTPPENEV